MSLLPSLPIAMLLFDDGAAIEVNHAWVQLTGLTGDTSLGGGWLRALHPDDRDGAYGDVTARDLAAAVGEWRVDGRCSYGRSVEAYVGPAALPGWAGMGEARIAALVDVSSRNAREVALLQGSTCDPLTGALGRAEFAERTSHALLRLRRSPDTLAVLVVSVDDIQVVRDRSGHPAGDEVLAATADRLREVVRPSDTLARVDDDFAILCEDLVERCQAIGIARRLLTAVRRPVLIDGVPRPVGASVGIAFPEGGCEGAERLIRHAGEAVYRVKRRGSGRYEVFDRLRGFDEPPAPSVVLARLERAADSVWSLRDQRVVRQAAARPALDEAAEALERAFSLVQKHQATDAAARARHPSHRGPEAPPATRLRVVGSKGDG